MLKTIEDILTQLMYAAILDSVNRQMQSVGLFRPVSGHTIDLAHTIRSYVGFQLFDLAASATLELIGNG